MAVVGLGLGAGLALLGIRIASRAIPGVPNLDVGAGIAVPLVICAVIALACFVPARRAAAVDPNEVLRQG